jgi:hypothetical protein
VFVTDDGLFGHNSDTPTDAMKWMMNWAKESELDLSEWEHCTRPPKMFDDICIRSPGMNEGHILRIAYNKTSGYWLVVSGTVEDDVFTSERHGASSDGPYHALVSYGGMKYKNEHQLLTSLHTHSYSQ